MLMVQLSVLFRRGYSYITLVLFVMTISIVTRPMLYANTWGTAMQLDGEMVTFGHLDKAFTPSDLMTLNVPPRVGIRVPTVIILIIVSTMRTSF